MVITMAERKKKYVLIWMVITMAERKMIIRQTSVNNTLSEPL